MAEITVPLTPGQRQYVQSLLRERDTINLQINAAAQAIALGMASVAPQSVQFTDAGLVFTIPDPPEAAHGE